MAGSNPGRYKQIIASLIVSVSSLMGGMFQGWTSPMTLKLQQSDSPVGYMSTEEIANLVTIPTYVGLGLGFVYAYATNRFGRKPSSLAAATPCFIGYFIMAFSTTKLWLYIGKIVTFAGNMGITMSQMYVSEIAHESIRGILMSICTAQINVGILIAYVFGKLMSFKWFNVLSGVIPGIFALCFIWMPETPYYYVEKGRYEDAKKSLMWLRGNDDLIAEIELEAIRNPSRSGEPEKKLTFSEILKARQTRLAALISVLAYFFQATSGIFAVINYAGVIFAEAGSPLSPDDSAIVTAVINLVASVINLFLIDRFGRKAMLYLSFVGSSISLTVLSIFLYISMKGADVGSLGWIPITSLSAFIFSYGIGLASVPGVIMNEISSTSMKAVLGTSIGLMALLCLSLVVQSFPYLDKYVGLYSCFAIPAVFNILGIVYTFFLVPETRGKSLSQISNELKNR